MRVTPIESINGFQPLVEGQSSVVISLKFTDRQAKASALRVSQGVIFYLFYPPGGGKELHGNINNQSLNKIIYFYEIPKY